MDGGKRVKNFIELSVLVAASCEKRERAFHVIFSLVRYHPSATQNCWGEDDIDSLSELGKLATNMFFLSISSLLLLLLLFFYFTTYKMFLWSKKRCIGHDEHSVEGAKVDIRKKKAKSFQLFEETQRERGEEKWDENPRDLVVMVVLFGWKIAKVLKVNLTKINLESSFQQHFRFPDSRLSLPGQSSSNIH